MSYQVLRGDTGDDSYVLAAATSGGATLYDSGGTDSLTFTDAAPTLTRQRAGVMGFSRASTDLMVDLNQDGGQGSWTGDLIIRHFFAGSYDTTPGSGFVETIGNLSGVDILGLDLLDYIPGGAGNDRIFGGSGRNYLTGGAGDDTYIITASGGGGSSIQDSSGTDTLTFTDASPVLSKLSLGAIGFARFSTSLHVDLNQDGETLWTEDLIIFNFFANSDMYSSTNAPGAGFIETIGNISGADILKLDFSTFFLGSERDDALTGRATNDTLVGGAGDDRLDGGAGNDTIRGGTEADLIVGGTGSDLLTGGDGADDFQFGGASRSRMRLTQRMSIDRITDFERGKDSIVLDKFTFKDVKRSSFKTVKTIAQAQNSNAQITYVQKTGALFYNQNGAAKGFGSGGQFADLQDGAALARGDFSIAS